MSEPNDRPLLTLALVSCNQEQFVREAVESAFAQTYSPLQIILSDDCSDDRSFDIMREMAAAYRGPHSVVLNRNPVRRKTGGHFNRVLELARGELIIIAAADDVSLPQRTEVAYGAWRLSGLQATSIYSDSIRIDENGRRIEDPDEFEQRKLYPKGQCVEQKVDPLSYVQTLKPAVHGAAHIISPKLFSIFGALPEAVMYEDKVLAFRSVLVGKLFYINEPLVLYRLHGDNVFKYRRRAEAGRDLKTLERQENQLQRDFRNSESMYGAFLTDLETARNKKLIADAEFVRIVPEAERRRKRCRLMGDYLESGFFRKCCILVQLKRLGLSPLERRILLKRLVPRTLFLRIRLARSRAALANQPPAVGITTR